MDTKAFSCYCLGKIHSYSRRYPRIYSCKSGAANALVYRDKLTEAKFHRRRSKLTSPTIQAITAKRTARQSREVCRASTYWGLPCENREWQPAFRQSSILLSRWSRPVQYGWRVKKMRATPHRAMALPFFRQPAGQDNEGRFWRWPYLWHAGCGRTKSRSFGFCRGHTRRFWNINWDRVGWV